jgi:hypothetical protein
VPAQTTFFLLAALPAARTKRAINDAAKRNHTSSHLTGQEGMLFGAQVVVLHKRLAIVFTPMYDYGTGIKEGVTDEETHTNPDCRNSYAPRR